MNLVGSGRFVPSHACFSSVLYVLGKVAIQKEDLQKYHNRDTWFQLQHVDADSEVQVRPPLEPMEHWSHGTFGSGRDYVVKKDKQGFGFNRD